MSTTRATASVTSLLAIAFTVLKLTHVINWSWLWVLAPVWIPLSLIAPVLIAVLIFARR